MSQARRKSEQPVESIPRHPDGVEVVRAKPAQLRQFDQALAQVEQMRLPQLLGDAPNVRVYVAHFDGTDNAMAGRDPRTWTNTAQLHAQLQRYSETDARIHSHYIPGVGTQTPQDLRTKLDQALGFSFYDRLDTQYWAFAAQATAWLKEDPDVQIRVVSSGYSRGAQAAAAFTRMIEERGIRDPQTASYRMDPTTGLVCKTTELGAALREPGTVVQAALLMDPVGTGDPQRHNRNLAPSVISALQLTALDEKRDQFASTSLIPIGFSEDQQFLHINLPGAHGNVGGGYFANGLSDRSANVAAQYVNGLLDAPAATRHPASAADKPDPHRDVIHRSEQHAAVYTTLTYRHLGERARIEGNRIETSPNEWIEVERSPMSKNLRDSVSYQSVKSVMSDAKSAANKEPINPKLTDAMSYGLKNWVEKTFNDQPSPELQLARKAAQEKAKEERFGLREVNSDVERLNKRHPTAADRQVLEGRSHETVTALNDSAQRVRRANEHHEQALESGQKPAIREAKKEVGMSNGQRSDVLWQTHEQRGGLQKHEHSKMHQRQAVSNLSALRAMFPPAAAMQPAERGVNDSLQAPQVQPAAQPTPAAIENAEIAPRMRR